MNHDSPTEIKAMLEQLGLSLKKRWGQNFLVNRNAREKIINLLNLKGGELVWEIGPGLGALTEILIARGASLVLFEIDNGLVRYLTEQFGSKMRVVAGDVVRVWQDEVRAGGRPNRVVGNLPYSSAGAIIGDFVEKGPVAESLVFTVQRELAERLAARPRTKPYSALSVLCQCFYDIRNHGDLKPGSFYPVPEVQSSVVQLEVRVGAPKPTDRALLSSVIHACFSSRRKTLRNGLLTGLDVELAKAPLLAAIDDEVLPSGARGEELTADQFIELSNRIAQALLPE